MPKVDIFLLTSTKSMGKIKKAGYRYILIYNGHTQEGKGTQEETTGNRLILTCAIEALKRMTKLSMITIHTDSGYFINGHKKLQTWKQNGWKGIKNVDLWQQFDKAQKGHAIQCCYEDMSIYK